MTQSAFPIPGSTVVATVNESRHAPGYWSYFLWDDDGGLVASGAEEFPPGISAEQVARVAFLLEVEYPSGPQEA